MLTDDPSAMLIDVRTRAEWDYVGRPDLATLGKPVHLVQWLSYPDMAVNPEFIREIQATGSRTDTTILLLCRSGQRSMYAATALAGVGYGSCYNIVDGFEGPRDKDGHRGTSQGWKAIDLPWTQD
jgi:rhodanese-related sulfurtransferase